MRLFSALGLLLSLCVTTQALHESDVGVVDWHKRLIGVPASGSITTAPAFHHVGEMKIILTVTENNVLAALEPGNGTVLWRYIFDPEDRIAGYYKNKDVIATISGSGGANLRTFDALTGQLVLEKRLHPPQLGVYSEPLHLGTQVIFSPNSADLYVLSNGCNVSRIDGATGEVKWVWTSPDHSSLIVHSNIVLTSDAVYAVGIAKSIASYTLHVSTLSPSTGELIASSNIASSIVNPLSEFAFLRRSDSSNPIAIWIEQGALRYIGLTPELKEKAKSIKGASYAQIQDVGLGDHGHIVAIRNDGSSFVLQIDGDAAPPKSIRDFETSAVSKSNAKPIYAGVIDTLGRPYVAQVHWSHTLAQGSADVFASHLISGQGLATAFTFPFNTKNHGVIAHAAVDFENPSGSTIQSRLLVTTSTGALQLWDQQQLKWTREESLATVALAELVELPERAASDSLDAESHESFFGRLTRHIVDMQNFPQYAFNFARRFVTGSYATASAPASTSTKQVSNSTEPLSRDAFGFRQVIIAATMFGKVFGIDSSNGEILWSRVLGLGRAGEIGGTVQPVKLYVTKAASDGGEPEVVLVAQRWVHDTLIDTVIFHINALTGLDATGVSPKEAVHEGQHVIQGPLVDCFLLNAEDSKVVILLDEFHQVYLYPDTPSTKAAFRAAAPNLSFPLRTTVKDHKRITGHQISLGPSTKNKPIAYPIWSLTLPIGEDVQKVIPPATRGPVASIGKVLGNRTTLYKYLNPRLFTVLTSSPAKKTCGIYVVDGAKGMVVYHAEVKPTSRGCDIETTFVENWLVYHYYETEVAGGTAGGAPGWRMVSVEFYEGENADEKIESSDLSSYSNDTLDFMTYERAFVFPHAITAIGPTTTKFGISSKDIIVATANHRIQSFSRQMLDPRRPSRKPTSEEQEEYLTQYDPLLPDDPRRVLSHNYEVANVERIITSPALLESTSLVFAYGLDLFLTRVAPSGTFDVLSENFNKAQLVFTVSGLILAIVVTRPMVQRKRLREKWYQS